MLATARDDQEKQSTLLSSPLRVTHIFMEDVKRSERGKDFNQHRLRDEGIESNPAEQVLVDGKLDVSWRSLPKRPTISLAASKAA